MEQHLIIHGLASQPHKIPLTQVTVTIGRDPQNDICLPAPTISHQHAQIVKTDQGYTIIDRHSTNGTLLNQSQLSPGDAVTLKSGDVIELDAREKPFRLEYWQVESGPASHTFVSLLEAVKEGKTSSSPEQATSEVSSSIYSPPGLDYNLSHYLHYLPDLYHTLYMRRFLALFEAILIPIEWHIDNFDLYLNPQTTPSHFLPWLEGWWDLPVDHTWSEAQRRQLLVEAPLLLTHRGSKWSIQRLLEIYTHHRPEIDDQAESLRFLVRLPREQKRHEATIEGLIDWIKPAHTSYKLTFS